MWRVWGCLLVACVPARPLVHAIEPVSCAQELVARLADDALAGRGIGTEGLERAGELLAERYRTMGMEPVEGSFQQTFQATTGVSLGDGNALSFGSRQGRVGEDFTPLGFSSHGAFAGEVVFAGYGIQAESLDYDDYAGVDVQGRVVLAMRFEPGEDDPESRFDGTRSTRFSDLRYKAMKAREAGVAALVFVAPARGEGEPDILPAIRSDGPVSQAGLPVMQISRAWADEWLATAGTDLATLRAEIDEAQTPSSRPIEGLKVEGEVELTLDRVEASNIVGVWPGAGDLKQETVVVGAHYDHLGHGGRGSMRPGEHAIHNGADDNASGVAAMVCGVERLRFDPPENRRTLVMVAFTAEEIGLAGSTHYVNHPVHPLAATLAMVNLDMVGRVEGGTLQALGTDSAPEWASVLDPASEASAQPISMGGDGYGPSDHMAFFDRGVPVVHFFSGAHDAYHTPQDDIDTLDYAGIGRVVQLLEGSLRGLLTREEGMTYTRTGRSMALGDRRDYRAYLGTVPDYTAMTSSEGGVLLSAVRDGGPADAAGIEGGDVIVSMAKVTIENLYDMTFVLQDHRPGETIEVTVERGDETVALQATLGRRGAPKVKSTDPHGGGDPHAPAPPAHGDLSVGAQPAGDGDWAPTAGSAVPGLLHADEAHLSGLRQLTFGGENAEAYWAPDGRRLILQRTPGEGSCDQQYVLDLTTGDMTLVSSGKGRTTCGYYTWPHGDRILYATTEGGGDACPEPPDRSQGYVWPLYDTFDIVMHEVGGVAEPWLPMKGYDAEATVCMVDGRVVFTSTRNGDLDLYMAQEDGTGLEQITDVPGYDGGAFFTQDCSALIWRASRPTGTTLVDYQRLLMQGLVRPGALEVFWMDMASREVEQLTENGAANFGPYPLPGQDGVIFSSNVNGLGREFDLHLVHRDTHVIEQVTHTAGFDGFPMFSPDGQWLVFASNRATAEGAYDTNLFLARWTDEGS
jgi:Tol biopolymer transport system component